MTLEEGKGGGKFNFNNDFGRGGGGMLSEGVVILSLQCPIMTLVKGEGG